MILQGSFQYVVLARQSLARYLLPCVMKSDQMKGLTSFTMANTFAQSSISCGQFSDKSHQFFGSQLLQKDMASTKPLRKLPDRRVFQQGRDTLKPHGHFLLSSLKCDFELFCFHPFIRNCVALCSRNHETNCIIPSSIGVLGW